MHKYEFDATITLNIQDIYASLPKNCRNENLFSFFTKIIIEKIKIEERKAQVE